MAFDKDKCSTMTTAGTSGISDAMERLGLARTVLTGFQCSVASGFAVAGTAFTVRQVPKHHPAQKDQRVVQHGEVSADLVQPGDFVVIDAGERTNIAGWGENPSRHCQTRGMATLPVNGATRDSAAIRRIGFPVFHLGISQSVVVAPNSFGADNACLLDALDQFGEKARGDCTRRCKHGGFEGAEWSAGTGGFYLVKGTPSEPTASQGLAAVPPI